MPITRWTHSNTRRRKVQQVSTIGVGEELKDIEVVANFGVKNSIEVMDKRNQQALDGAIIPGLITITTSYIFQRLLSKSNPSTPKWFDCPLVRKGA